MSIDKLIKKSLEMIKNSNNREQLKTCRNYVRLIERSFPNNNLKILKDTLKEKDKKLFDGEEQK